MWYNFLVILPLIIFFIYHAKFYLENILIIYYKLMLDGIQLQASVQDHVASRKMYKMTVVSHEL